jgi:hypothetical protein
MILSLSTLLTFLFFPSFLVLFLNSLVLPLQSLFLFFLLLSQPFPPRPSVPSSHQLFPFLPYEYYSTNYRIAFCGRDVI